MHFSASQVPEPARTQEQQGAISKGGNTCSDDRNTHWLVCKLSGSACYAGHALSIDCMSKPYGACVFVEMMKAGLIDEMMNDTLDSALDGEDVEEETEEQISQVCGV